MEEHEIEILKMEKERLADLETYTASIYPRIWILWRFFSEYIMQIDDCDRRGEPCNDCFVTKSGEEVLGKLKDGYYISTQDAWVIERLLCELSEEASNHVCS